MKMTVGFRRTDRTGGPFIGAMIVSALAALSWPAAAQNLFAPAVYVNDAAITNYEVGQRVLLLEFLRTPGDLAKISVERLIDEGLQLQAARRAGFTVTDDQITAGIEEFAGRAELNGNEFLADLARQGIAPESFRDFVRAGIAWRQLVRARFATKSSVNDAEIDLAISLGGTRGSARVLISEIFLPINTPQNAEISRDLAPKIARLTTVAEFSDAARRFSAGPSRDRGGVVGEWVPLQNLPPQIRGAMLSMKPGQVTDPIEIPKALALFQLRALQETSAPAARDPVLDYAVYLIDGAQNGAALPRAAQVRARADTCDDLYGIARRQPADVLERQKLPVSEIPTDYALELAKLDANEVSTALTRSGGDTLVFLMLCGRNRTPEAEVSRDEMRLTLSNRRLTGLAEAYLDELRANASIRYP